jgi:hypothetical protein
MCIDDNKDILENDEMVHTVIHNQLNASAMSTHKWRSC